MFIERVWRSIKCEEVYVHAYETVSAAREGISRYINFYTTRRPHSSHQARTPDVVYFASLPQPSAEATSVAVDFLIQPMASPNAVLVTLICSQDLD